jgi:hypothetical protein
MLKIKKSIHGVLKFQQKVSWKFFC